MFNGECALIQSYHIKNDGIINENMPIGTKCEFCKNDLKIGQSEPGWGIAVVMIVNKIRYR
jgi:hypothetical protein